MRRVIAAIVRHGRYQQPVDVPSAHLLYPLTEGGRGDARGLADEMIELAKLHSFTIDSVIDSSPLLRAWQTAQIVAEELGARTGRTFVVEQHDDLMERSLGAAANLTERQIEELIAADPRLYALPAGWKRTSAFCLPVPGAESLLEAGERTRRKIEERLAELSGSGDPAGCSCRIVVGHGGSLRHAAVYMGVINLGQASELSMHHGRPVLLERGPEGAMRHMAGSWKRRSKAAARAGDP